VLDAAMLRPRMGIKGSLTGAAYNNPNVHITVSSSKTEM